VISKEGHLESGVNTRSFVHDKILGAQQFTVFREEH
jgi:hypothetical protein